MNDIVKALKQRLLIHKPLASNVFSGSLALGPDFPGFQGHFPGNPILPGVCLIEAAVQLISSGAKRNLFLAELERVKFFSPVKPGDKVELDFHVEYLADGVAAKGTIMSGQRKICTIKMKLAGEKS
jgi:3-hydroxymyristoyl/3-hydroxydecanoyl-(acyl carrier protein) dehydratase